MNNAEKLATAKAWLGRRYVFHPAHEPNDKEIADAIKKIVATQIRIEIEREVLANTFEDICRRQKLNRGVFRIMVANYRKNSFLNSK